MPKYRIISGTFGGQDPGNVVEIPEDVRASMPDGMFERVELEETDDRAVPMSDADPDSPEASTDLPDDWHTLRSMAVVADGIAGDANGTEIRAHFEDYEPGEIAQIRQQAEARLED